MNRALSLSAIAVASLATASADAQFLGWTMTSRTVSVSNTYLVNVFAVVQNETDVLINVFGPLSNPSNGIITTTSPGGFLQGTGAQSVFAPSGSQSWTTLDSFLTIGGGYNSSTGVWSANASTLGDPLWNRAYFDTGIGESVTVNAFGTPSNGTGFVNPYVSYVPQSAGWFHQGSVDPLTHPGRARSLAGIEDIRVANSQGAAAGQFGVLVAQFYMLDNLDLNFRMSATVRLADGNTESKNAEVVLPAPGGIAILGVAGVIGARRRRH